MTKHEFLKRLSRALGRMKRDEREKSLAFYREMIDDRIESGLTEEEAVAQMEPIDDIAAGILQDAAARGALRKAWNPVLIALLVIGSPLWASLLVVLFAVLAAFTVCLWVIVVCLYSVVAALGAAVLSLLVAAAVLLRVPFATVALVAAALVCGGFAVLFCLLANLTARAFARLTGSMWSGVCRVLFKRRKPV